MLNDPGKAIPYNKALDGLRGLAILLVVMSHVQLLHYGWIGVQLFFVLSGFLITTILLKEKEKQVSLKTKFRNFWARRVLRIFPLYYLYLFFLIIYWWCSGDLGNQSSNLPWLFTYTFNFSGIFQHNPPHFLTSHLWTLSVEEQFYIFYPFLVLLCPIKQLRRAASFLVLFSIAFRFLTGQYLLRSGWPGAEVGAFIYTSTFSHLDAFLLGGSIALFNIYQLSLRKKYFIFFAMFIIAITYGLSVYLTIRPGHFSFNDYITHLGYTPEVVTIQHHVWSYFILDILFASLLLLLLSPGNLFARFFTFAPLVAIGKVSYGMYMIQSGILYAVLSFAHYCGVYNKYFDFLLFLPVLYVSALILYHAYEKRFLVWKEKFR
ncbi:MAG: acyltransferase [Bacteroidota bacterium]|nr:acyltransferase [Bacteroidota bacterium]